MGPKNLGGPTNHVVGRCFFAHDARNPLDSETGWISLSVGTFRGLILELFWGLLQIAATDTGEGHFEEAPFRDQRTEAGKPTVRCADGKQAKARES